MTPVGAAFLVAVLLLPLAIALGWRAQGRALDRACVRRSERRALEVAERFGLRARRDPEIPTTWHLEGAVDGLAATIAMGSPRLFSGWRATDWLKLELRGRPFVPAGVRIRPAERTFYEWKDGLPGEPGDVRVGGSGVEVVVEPKEALREWPFLRGQIERLPHRSWPEEVDRERFAVRARPGPDAAPARVVRDLVDTALVWADRAASVGYRA